MQIIVTMHIVRRVRQRCKRGGRGPVIQDAGRAPSFWGESNGEGERYPTTVSRCAHPQLEDELRPNCTLNRNTAQHHGRAAEFLNAS